MNKSKKIHLSTHILIFLLAFITMTVSAKANIGGYILADDTPLYVHTLHKAGNDNENFVILFLGDGYTIAVRQT